VDQANSAFRTVLVLATLPPGLKRFHPALGKELFIGFGDGDRDVILFFRIHSEKMARFL
jgi:hypothetical protein